MIAATLVELADEREIRAEKIVDDASERDEFRTVAQAEILPAFCLILFRAPEAAPAVSRRAAPCSSERLCDNPFLCQSAPDFLKSPSAYCSENAPRSSLGVGTMTNEISNSKSRLRDLSLL
jgi:hypothetical protein